MGVEREDYLMYGVDLGYEAFDWDKHEAERDGAPNRRFDIVADGMSGKYCIAGKIIAKSDGYDGIGMNTIDPDHLGVDRAALARVVSEAFGKPVDTDDLKLILFSHFH